MSKQQLVQLMESVESLNYQALIAIHKRSEELGVQPSESFIKSLEFEKGKIDNLIYLKNLGFKLKGSIELGLFEIVRSTSAKLIDLLTMLVGVCFIFFLPLTWNSITLIINDGLSFSTLVSLIATLTIGILGITLFSKAVNRIAEYWNIGIIKDSNGLIIRKSGKEYVESRLGSDFLDVSYGENKTVLNYIVNEEKVSLINSVGGVKQKLTIERLQKLLST